MEVFKKLEKCLLPPPVIVTWSEGKLTVKECTTREKVVYFAQNFFSFFGTLLAAGFSKSSIAPLHQEVKSLTSKEISWPPKQRGFASSLFQTSGLGTRWAKAPVLQGKCDWDKWMAKNGHIKAPQNFDYNNFFTDVLTDPTNYIKMLKEHNVTAHRFSLEWSVIEPEPGKIDENAVRMYKNFIQKLINSKITPSVTLCHFVLPEWFYESGSFQKMENIDRYVDFAIKTMKMFPEVKDWWSFNELGVRALQQAREVYPTDAKEGSWMPARITAAGTSTRNMLIAHCKLHVRASIECPGQKVGVTHQWLKFSTESGNWLESLLSHYFTNFAFTPVYQFFETGCFKFQFPFMANIQFEVPKEEFEKHQHFLQRLGVQMYPQAYLKMGLNHGETYPGLKETVQNFPFFTFGSSCEPGGSLMRFGPRHAPQEVKNILDEAFKICPEVFITEFGSDAFVQKWGETSFSKNDEAQKEYFSKLYENIRDYSLLTGREIQGMFAWTDLRRQLEWENGHECCLGMIEAVVDHTGKLTGWISTQASRYLKEAYAPFSKMKKAS